MMAPPPSPPRRKGRGWMVFALIVLVLLVFSVFLNIGHLMRGLLPARVAGSRSAGPRLEEVVK